MRCAASKVLNKTCQKKVKALDNITPSDFAQLAIKLKATGVIKVSLGQEWTTGSSGVA